MILQGNRFRDTTFAFVDVETTGLCATNDRVVEVACVVTRAGRRVASFASLIDPGCHIAATASAVHHLTDDSVRGAPPLDAIEPQLRAFAADAVIVAHNAAFDLAFLPFLRERPALCSMRFAQIALPDAPNYKNQVLRYHLGIRDPELSAAAAHRALGDALVTSLVFDICVERYLAAGGRDDVAHAIRATQAPRVLPAFGFGKHRGTPIADVPSDYLQWLAMEATSPSRDARHTAKTELWQRGSARRAEAAPRENSVLRPHG